MGKILTDSSHRRSAPMRTIPLCIASAPVTELISEADLAALQHYAFLSSSVRQ